MSVLQSSEKKQTILLVHNYYQIPGGEDSVMANEKKLLEEHGHKVILYTRHNNELKSMPLIKKIFLPFSTVFNIRTYREVKQLIQKQHIDLVHVHNTLNLVSPAVFYAAVKCKVPVVQTIHNFRMQCPGATFYRDGRICEDCLQFGLRCAVKHSCYRGSKIQTFVCACSIVFHRWTGIYRKINYICLTEFNRQKLLELNKKSKWNKRGKQIIDPEKVFVKPNFVENTVQVLPDKKRKNQFIYVGRLDELKGIRILFAAWADMRESAPELIVCGTGPLEDWCLKEIKEKKLNIEMKGFVPNVESREYIAKSRALILPTQWYEGFPMTIAEAYSVGTPIICSKLGNAGSVVQEGITGMKFEVNNVKALVKCIRDMEKKSLSVDQIFYVYHKLYNGEENYKQLQNVYLRCK